MAYEVPGFVYTLESTGDIRQFRAVEVDANGLAEEVDTADTDPIAGVAQMPAADAQQEPIRIMQSGITFAEAGDDVTAGDMIATDADGRFVDDNAGGNIVGIALTSAGAAGEYFALLLL